MLEAVSATGNRIHLQVHEFLEAPRHETRGLCPVAPLVFIEEKWERIRCLIPCQLRMVHERIDEAAGEVVTERPAIRSDLNATNCEPLVRILHHIQLIRLKRYAGSTKRRGFHTHLPFKD